MTINIIILPNHNEYMHVSTARRAHQLHIKVSEHTHNEGLKRRVKSLISLVHYSFAPLILFRVPYTLDLLPYYLSISNGAGGVDIFELFVFQCFV